MESRLTRCRFSQKNKLMNDFFFLFSANKSSSLVIFWETLFQANPVYGFICPLMYSIWRSKAKTIWYFQAFQHIVIQMWNGNFIILLTFHSTCPSCARIGWNICRRTKSQKETKWSQLNLILTLKDM